ncbi:MAG: proline--tRNA ligase [Deltaproteobacteria bacterium]|nr:proline--tRNA ligase [Deltaproteobacteria bacterium]
MLLSQLFAPTLRETPAEAETISHRLMLRAGMIRKLAAGVYSYLPLGLRVIEKVERIIREELNTAGAQEVLLPIVMPKELWEETGRWGKYGKELLRFKDRHDREFCFGPTHEEAITDLVRSNVKSYRDLPLNLYQIQTKFRDEVRPRFGLMRGREFIMKDCYSFDVSEEASRKIYQKMFETYKKIFARCGLVFKVVEAGTGVIGGSLSHEFQVLAGSGEDAVLSCVSCEWGMNKEMATEKGHKKCPHCGKELKEYRGIEVGQVFYLGTKYSFPMKAFFLDEKGNQKPIVMGCYGIGVGRTAAAAIEQNHDENGIIWPLPIAPFHVELLPLQDDPAVRETAQKLYQGLQKEKIEVLMDDRSESAGVKFKDADLIGIPYRIVVGTKGLKEGKIELKERKGGQVSLIPVDAVIGELKKKLDSLLAG